VLAPDPNRRLSQGALVEARVHARVLGIPLLKVEALIALIPAGATANVPQAAEARTREVAQPAASQTRRWETPGSGLAEAIRNLEEANDMLAAVRRNGSERAFSASGSPRLHR
jgi:hypothetical protein